MIQGKGSIRGGKREKNLSFEIKTKASVTDVTPATQLHEVKREHQDTKGCSVGSALGMNSQPRRKRPHNSLQSQLRGCSNPSLGWELEGSNAQSCSSQRPGQAPALFLLPATSDSDTWGLPRGFLGDFPGLVPGKLLWQSRIGVCSSPGCGEHFPSLTSGQFSLVQLEPGLILGMLFLILISPLQELQDRQPWLPVTLAQFLVCPFGQRGHTKGRKAAAVAQGMKG